MNHFLDSLICRTDTTADNQEEDNGNRIGITVLVALEGIVIN